MLPTTTLHGHYTIGKVLGMDVWYVHAKKQEPELLHEKDEHDVDIPLSSPLMCWS